MESKASNERKSDSAQEDSVNKPKTTIIKKMIFHTETFPQIPTCQTCKRFKCDCKKNVPEHKQEPNPNPHTYNTQNIKFPTKIEKEKKDIFLGNKRKTIVDKPVVILSQKNNNFIEKEEVVEKHNVDNNILDLNMLYDSVSPPSELNEELNDEKSSSNNRKIRKSTRIKKEKTHVFQIFYCHQCKKSDNTLNMLICTNPACRDAYCVQCLKKYYLKADSTNENIKSKIEEERKDWICYMCRGKCTCKICNRNFEILESIRENEKSSEGKINKKTQPGSAQLVEEEKKQNVVKIDDYVIYENEGPDDEDSDNSINIDNDIDEEFTEKSRKVERKGKYMNRNLKKKEKILNPISRVCLICSKDRSAELLNFKSIGDFLNNLKKIYESSEENKKESEEYNKNKNSFNDYFKNYNKHYSNDYVFKTIKYICKPCFNYNLSIKDGFNTLFTYLHLSVQPNTILQNDIKPVVQSKQNFKAFTTENKITIKENHIDNNITQTISSNNNNAHIIQNASGTTVNFVKNTVNDNNTIKLMNDLAIKKDIKQIENCDKIELNIENKKSEISNTNKILDVINIGKSTSNNINNNNINNNNINGNNSNPLLKFLNMMNQNPSNSVGNNSSSNLLSNNNLVNPNSTATAPQYSSGNLNNNSSINSLVNMIQSMQNNSQLQGNPNTNMLLQQVLSMNNNNPSGQNIINNNNPVGQNLMNNSNLSSNGGQQQNLNHITSNIGKLVDIISQYNQKHLNQNASMLSNINNLVNTMSNIVPFENKTCITQSKMDKNDNPLHDSLKENTLEKKDNKGENIDNNNSNENIINFPINDEKKDLSSIIHNFDNSKNNLSTYMFNVLDELKKQIYSIQYYSLVQKLFISYIFKNLDIFIEQLANNQAIHNLNSSQLYKSSNTPGLNGFGDNMNSLSDQLVLLKKLAENLAMNQMNNPLINSTNLEELTNLFGGQNSFGQMIGVLNNSFNNGNPNIPSVSSLINIQNTNPQNNNVNNISVPNNNMGTTSNMKNSLQSINTILNKDPKSIDLNNTNNNLNTNTNINNSNTNQAQNTNSNHYQNYCNNDNMLERFLKGMKPSQTTTVPNHLHSNPNQGQIIMPINIETNSTNIIQNPAHQMYNLNNSQQQHPGINQNNMSNLNGMNMSQNSLLLQLNSLMNQGNTAPQGFGQNGLMNNPNLMSLLLQNNNNANTNQFPDSNNPNQKF